MPINVATCFCVSFQRAREIVHRRSGLLLLRRKIHITWHYLHTSPTFSCRFAEVQKKGLDNVHSLYRSVYKLHTRLKEVSGSLSSGNHLTLNCPSGKSAKHPVLPDLIVGTSLTAVTAAPWHLTTTVRNRWNAYIRVHVRKPGVNKL
jgi:hypothetical protein